MQLDAIDLKEFYACPLGVVVRRLLGARVRSRWADVKGLSVFGVGFATPYLPPTGARRSPWAHSCRPSSAPFPGPSRISP
jgi:hypothetical protein